MMNVVTFVDNFFIHHEHGHLRRRSSHLWWTWRSPSKTFSFTVNVKTSLTTFPFSVNVRTSFDDVFIDCERRHLHQRDVHAVNVETLFDDTATPGFSVEVSVDNFLIHSSRLRDNLEVLSEERIHIPNRANINAKWTRYNPIYKSLKPLGPVFGDATLKCTASKCR